MATMKSHKVASSLKKKGFVEQTWRKGHTFYHFTYLGKEYPIETHMSRGNHGEEIHDKLIKAMAEQLCLTRKEFEDLIECPMTKEMYVEILRKQGKLV